MAITSIEPPAGRFATTCWSTVAAAGGVPSRQAEEAVERLCRHYWRVLYGFALRQGRDVHTAQDLTQAFFAHFLQRGYLRAADRARGRFRTFLLTCFEHFLAHEWEKQQAAKRGGGLTWLSWDEHGPALEAWAAVDRDRDVAQSYDRAWALALMGRALARLQAEFEGAGRGAHFQVLGTFLHAEAAPGEYLRIASQLGWTDRAVKLAVHRLRRRYGHLVREEVRETVARESDAEDEMRYLVELISG